MTALSTILHNDADATLEVPWPDVSDLITEDDTPVDNIFSEKQQRLLVESLYSSWPNPPFVAMANVGLFYRIHHPPLVPDMLLSHGVEMHEEVWSKAHRSYLVWEFGKPPDLVVEVVSNTEGHEADTKLQGYASMGVKYCAIFDPERILSQRLLRLYELHGMSYVEQVNLWMPGLDIGFHLWEGTYEGLSTTWLRWRDSQGVLIATGTEQAKQERIRAEQLAQRLRALGVDPETV